MERCTAAEPSYVDVGATRREDFPVGYRHDRYQAEVGRGDAVFRDARECLSAWQAHACAGVQVVPADAPVETGLTVVLVMRVGPVWAIAPCRVVYVIDEDDRAGFAYGTLPGHPERGEEAFVVERDSSELVTFRVTAFSRPADLLARVGAPVARIAQRRVTLRYIEALRDCAGRPG